MSRPIPAQPKHVFVRSYQACVPCRKRKVRCDLGDPGNPSDPPCQRCRREHKDCFFQDLRTKKTTSTSPTPSKADSTNITPTSSAQPPAKRQRQGELPAHPTLSPALPLPPQLEPLADAYRPPLVPTTTNHHAHAHAQHHHHHHPLPAAISPTESSTAERILHKEVHNANEALNLLYEAAAEGRNPDDTSRAVADGAKARFSDSDNANTLAWRDFWCVRAGWMTDLEARCYVDL
jgi:hypothetical protein